MTITPTTKRYLLLFGSALLTTIARAFPQYAQVADTLRDLAFVMLGIAIPSPGQLVTHEAGEQSLAAAPVVER